MSIYDQMHDELQTSAVKKQQEIDAARARLDELASGDGEYFQLMRKAATAGRMTPDEIDQLEKMNLEFRRLARLVADNEKLT